MKKISTLLTLLPFPLLFIFNFILSGKGPEAGYFMFLIVFPILIIATLTGIVLKIREYLRKEAKINPYLISLFVGNLFLFLPGEDFNPYVITIFNIFTLLAHLITRRASSKWLLYPYLSIFVLFLVLYYPVTSEIRLKESLLPFKDETGHLVCIGKESTKEAFVANPQCSIERGSTMYSFPSSYLSAEGFSYEIINIEQNLDDTSTNPYRKWKYTMTITRENSNQFYEFVELIASFISK